MKKNFWHKRKGRKKGRALSIRRMLFYTLFRAGYFYSLLAFIATLLLCVANLVFNALALSATDLYPAEVGKLFLSIAATIGTAFGSIRSALALKRMNFNANFVHNKAETEIVEKATSGVSPIEKEAGFRWEFYMGEYFLCSDPVDDFLFDENCVITLNVIGKKTRLDSKCKRILYPLVASKLRAGTIIFDSDLVRLKTDIDLMTHTVTLQITDYFYNSATNDMIFMSAKVDSTEILNGESYTLDKEGRLYSLSESLAANIIGVSTCAITCDGYVIINKQSERNDFNGGLLLPSGSGSADFDDLLAEIPDKKAIADAHQDLRNARKVLKNLRTEVLNVGKKAEPSEKAAVLQNYIQACEKEATARKRYEEAKSMRRYKRDFRDFLACAMKRELCEETHIPHECVRSTRICGYARIFSRGGKPDFFGMTFLSCNREAAKESFLRGKFDWTLTEIKKKKAIMDYTEIESVEFIPLSEIENANDVTEIPSLQGRRMSLQLYRMLTLLKKYMAFIKRQLETVH